MGWARSTFSERERALRRKTHQTIKRVTADIERFQYNTAIAAMMELLNEMYSYCPRRADRPQEADVRAERGDGGAGPPAFPFRPAYRLRILERARAYRLRCRCNPGQPSTPRSPPPKSLEIPVQVNGKLRERLTVPVDTDPATLERLALDSDAVRRAIGETTVRKVIVVPGKLVNIVAK